MILDKDKRGLENQEVYSTTARILRWKAETRAVWGEVKEEFENELLKINE